MLGAGGLGLVRALSGSDGVDADVDADAEAMCGILERTPPLSADSSAEDMPRWAVVEVAPSLAEADPRYGPLADKLEQAFRVYRVEFDLDKGRQLVDDALELCDDL